MKIGIGLPATHPDAGPDVVLDWARRADAGPFSSVGIVDRLLYDSMESLVTLSAAAASTTRVRLLTALIVAPLRSTGLLAKQTATIQRISHGRLSLGVGVGTREDDFLAEEMPYHHRGARLDGQLEALRRVWTGGAFSEEAGPIGPSLAGMSPPELLIGGRSAKAVSRVGLWADGYLGSPVAPETLAGVYDLAVESWRANGRPGKPRLVGTAYFSLGERASEHPAAYVDHYYTWISGAARDRMIGNVLATPERIREGMDLYESIGMDELLLLPTDYHVEQLELLAELVR